MDKANKRIKNIILIGMILFISIFIPIFCTNLWQNNINFGVANLIKTATNQQCMATFSTSYATSGSNRKHNVQTALNSLNGVAIKPNETFSFNQTVGERTEERGYKQALIIMNGNYIKGVGGGVCQVSTTLYNAWLLAGLDAISVKAHSLPASYVDLSRDATVSSSIDMQLKNTSAHSVTIKTFFDDSTITVQIWGNKKQYNYELISEKIETIMPDEEIVVLDEIGENEFYPGKNGYISRLIIKITDGDRTIAKRELRRDYYIPQNSIKIVRK